METLEAMPNGVVALEAVPLMVASAGQPVARKREAPVVLVVEESPWEIRRRVAPLAVKAVRTLMAEAAQPERTVAATVALGLP